MISSQSVDCLKDYLSVQSGRNTKKRYCGVGGFSIESEADEMNITFSSSYWSKGGKFLCLLQAIENFQENNNCHCGWKNPVSNKQSNMHTSVSSIMVKWLINGQ